MATNHHTWMNYAVYQDGEVFEESPCDPPQRVYVPRFVATELLRLAEENERLKGGIRIATPWDYLTRAVPAVENPANQEAITTDTELCINYIRAVAAKYDEIATKGDPLFAESMRTCAHVSNLLADCLRDGLQKSYATRHDASLQDKPPAQE